MKKLTSLILAGLLLLAPAMVSCNSEPDKNPAVGETIPAVSEEKKSAGQKTDAEPEEIVTRTTHLTGIFAKEQFPKVSSSFYSRNYPPEFDENGNFRIYGKFGEGDDRITGLATVAPDGEVLNVIKCTLHNTSDSIRLMTATDDTIYYTQRTDGSMQIGQMGAFIASCGTYESGKLIDLTDWFTDYMPYGFDMTGLCTDKAGNVYLSTALEVAVLSPDLTVQFLLKPDGGITAMNTDQNGVVYIASGEGDSYGLYPIDPEKQALGTPHLLGDLRIENLFFADGYDFYYTDHQSAVFGVKYPVKEGAPPKISIVLDFNNSGVSHTTFTLMNVADPETMIVVQTENISNFPMAPVLFRKAPDRPLEDITVIEVAYTTSDYYFETDVMEFNRTHKDIMVVLQDYSRFSNEIEPDAGEKRLAMDVVTGVYRPDIILGTYDQPVVKTVVDRGDYVNLMPYVSTDSLVAKDNIFPGILYSYSTDDGKLWGLPLDFSIRTLIANDALTGGLTKWNFVEMISFADSLPDGVSMLQHLSQSTAAAQLLGDNAYAPFVDLKAGTCNFDTPEFAQYLEFLKSLPKERRFRSSEEEFGERADGKVVLYEKNISEITAWYQSGVYFGTPDVTWIGFPVADGSKDGSAQMFFTESYTILSTCESPDAAWEFIRYMLGDLFVYTHFKMARGLPILMSKCRGMAESTLDTIYNWYFSGGGYSSIPKTEEQRERDLAEPIREPGIRVIPTPEMIDDFINFLRDSTGQRIISRIPDEITAIVNEEIKTYLTGVKDAKSCANVIQSRVKIWLAEHE